MFSWRNFALLVLIVAAVTICWLPAVELRASNGVPQSPSGDSSAKVCEFAPPGASFSIPYVSQAQELNTNPDSPTWAHAAATWIEKDCSHQIDYPHLKTEVRAFWTDSDLYLLFISPYTELNLWLLADNTKDRLKLWDRDVVEFFLGDDWQNIKRYREFEIAPTGDWVDLAIDLNKDTYDAKWDSGWQRQGRIDEKIISGTRRRACHCAPSVKNQSKPAPSGASISTASTGWVRTRFATLCAGNRLV